MSFYRTSFNHNLQDPNSGKGWYITLFVIFLIVAGIIFGAAFYVATHQR